jgi:hypothetical protein
VRLVSPSKIQTHRNCQRLAGWVYIEKLRTPATNAQTVGIDVHKVLEDHIAIGKPINVKDPIGKIANAGLVYLPTEPGRCEGSFQLPVDGSVTYDGDGNWISTGDVYWNGVADWVSTVRPYVIDHKTTSDFKWVKSVETLKDDPQVLIYGALVMCRFPSFDKVDYRYIYYRTKGAAKAMPVDFELYYHELNTKLKGLRKETISIADTLANTSDVMRLTPNPEHCNAYGGCPFRDKCRDVIPRSKSMSDVNQFLEALKARAAASQPAAQVAAPVTASAALPVPVPVAVQTTIAPAGAGGPLDQIAALQAQLAALQKGNVAAPVVHAPTTEEAEKRRQCSKCGAVGHNARTCPAKQINGILPAAQTIEAAQVAPDPTAHAARLALPVGALALDPAAMPQPLTSPVPDAALVCPVAPVAHVASNAKPIATLYIDCLPIGESVLRLDGCFAEVASALQTQMQIPHYKMAEYGKGPGLWALGVDDWIKRNLTNQEVFIDTSSNQTRDALDAITANAENIIRGIR